MGDPLCAHTHIRTYVLAVPVVVMVQSTLSPSAANGDGEDTRIPEGTGDGKYNSDAHHTPTQVFLSLSLWQADLIKRRIADVVSEMC